MVVLVDLLLRAGLGVPLVLDVGLEGRDLLVDVGNVLLDNVRQFLQARSASPRIQ